MNEVKLCKVIFRDSHCFVAKWDDVEIQFPHELDTKTKTVWVEKTGETYVITDEPKDAEKPSEPAKPNEAAKPNDVAKPKRKTKKKDQSLEKDSDAES